MRQLRIKLLISIIVFVNIGCNITMDVNKYRDGYNSIRKEHNLPIVENNWSCEIDAQGSSIIFTNPIMDSLLLIGKPFYGRKEILIDRKQEKIKREIDIYYTGKIGIFYDPDGSIKEWEQVSSIYRYESNSYSFSSIATHKFDTIVTINQLNTILKSMGVSRLNYPTSASMVK